LDYYIYRRRLVYIALLTTVGRKVIVLALNLVNRFDGRLLINAALLINVALIIDDIKLAYSMRPCRVEIH